MEKFEPRDILQREARWPDDSAQIEASSGHLLEARRQHAFRILLRASQNPLIFGHKAMLVRTAHNLMTFDDELASLSK